ncbi:MAG TPA: DUF1385 domain-containing protein [Clostridia bacterium]
MKDTKIRPTSIGGQALIEGVMMRGPKSIAMAVRKPDGEIIIEDKIPPQNRPAILKKPIIRGVVEFFSMMVIGMQSLMWSAQLVEIEEETEQKPSKIDNFLEKVFGEKLMTAVIYFSVIVSLAFSVVLFMLLPNFIAGLFHFNKDVFSGVLLYNLIEGVVKLVIFFAYIAITSGLKDIKRVWEYHGAEHKTIHCHEHGDELTVENAKKYTTLHPRCGTSFMFIVLMISIIIFAFTGWYKNPLLNMAIRIALMPVVAGVSYEVLKFAGRHTNNPIIKVLNSPGMFLQKYTTKEPDDLQLEVAIAAFKRVMVEDKTDKW